MARLTEVDKQNPWYYLKRDNWNTLSLIDEAGLKGGILAYMPVSSLIPVYTSDRVVYGDFSGMREYTILTSSINEFYQNTLSSTKAKSFL